MKRKKVISLLLAGVMAISQPLSLQASDISYESTIETETETLPDTEPATQNTEMDITAVDKVDETETQTTQEVLPDTLKDVELSTGETDTAGKESLTGYMILPNNTA